VTVQFIRPFYEALARSSATQRQFDSHVKVLSPLCCDKTLYSASGHQKLPLQEEPAVKVQECRRGHLQTGQPSLYASRIKPCVDFSHSCRMGFNEPISSFLALRQLDIHDYSDFNSRRLGCDKFDTVQIGARYDCGVSTDHRLYVDVALCCYLARVDWISWICLLLSSSN